jgi:glyoxylase-like metal-dependent hydrolase (beta-lactamase superfamily II)
MENLYAIVQENEKQIRANTYLLLGEPNLLIDSGFMPKEEIGIVLLTHCHADHTVFVEKLKKLGAKIAVGEADSVELEKNTEVRQPDWARKKWGETPSCKPDIILKKGELISNGNFVLEVIECPGHTPGSVAFFDKKHEILFSGDTWYGGDSIGSWDHPGGNLAQLQSSVEKLKKLNAKMLCSGHGTAKWKN